MKTRSAMAASVALAVGAHAALLMRHPPGLGQAAGAGAAAMSVRLLAADAPSVDAHAIAEVTSPQSQTEAPVEATPPAAAAPSAQTEEAVPAFEGGVPSIGFPDAPLPEGGADVRAYLVLDGRGAPQSVTTSAPPQLPAGFQKLTEAALRQARLQPGHAAAYCLLARFDPQAPEARLAWLPGVAKDAGRCLAGALPAPREIEPAP